MHTKEDVLKALRMVSHPEKGSDIVTLGMVSDVTVTAEGINILRTRKSQMTLSSPQSRATASGLSRSSRP